MEQSPPTTKHHILLLNAPFSPPTFSFPHTLTHLTNTTVDTTLPSLSTATIAITAAVHLSHTTITRHCPSLRAIICMGTGVDNISLSACQERGITLCNTPSQNIASVSEHALALFMALKRKVVPLHAATLDGETWAARKLMIGAWEGGPPRTNGEEVMGVVGYGALGKGVAELFGRNGMEVLVAERKGMEGVRGGRTAFEEVLRRATVVVFCAPLDEGTRGMVGARELGWMRRDALLVNVGRGGIVEEKALVRALREGEIAGAATDVFEHEPARKESCPLLEEGVPNLLLSPHVAWYSKTTLDGAKKMIHDNVEMYVKGTPQNVIIQGTM
ncbi:D-3-phosphoglycerate dehydrogenase-like protein [Elsinoe australis]|uniref:D-3-phosphoglycerate dehydrogenase-like protein n=1 Tax=Elsinoe australis TaxID=40998 RepID=A0A4U7AX75_9PEZI|nr:D-3-phosphoglycerate dehydrogenase-like protein [Elsinoe australis]